MVLTATFNYFLDARINNAAILFPGRLTYNFGKVMHMDVSVTAIWIIL